MSSNESMATADSVVRSQPTNNNSPKKSSSSSKSRPSPTSNNNNVKTTTSPVSKESNSPGAKGEHPNNSGSKKTVVVKDRNNLVSCESNAGDNHQALKRRMFETEDLDKIAAPGRLARKRIRDVKHKARSELVKEDLFCSEKYYLNFDLEKFRNNFSNRVEDLPPEVTDQMKRVRPFTVDRIDGRTLTEKEFIEKFEKTKIPAIFTHLIDDWPAYKENAKWSSLSWLDRKFRNQKFKCGEDDNGCSVKLKMKYYLQYMKSTVDDSPLYVFDSNYGEHAKRKKLLNDYTVPHLFKEDLFQFAGENKRPPYRWFVMGPQRSGTGIHIDPLGTSAWNSLIRGAKRWVLLPNDVPKHLVKPTASDNCSKQKDEAVTWFRHVYPRVTSPTWPAKWRPIEFLQLPGETVFVPGGWWHLVLNLEASIAMTQNYCNTGNFRTVWLKTARGRPRFSHKWYRTLKKMGRSDLIEIANDVSKNYPEHIPNMVIDTSSSDSSSDTSTASSDDEEDSSVEVSEDTEKSTTLSTVQASNTNLDNSMSSISTTSGGLSTSESSHETTTTIMTKEAIELPSVEDLELISGGKGTGGSAGESRNNGGNNSSNNNNRDIISSSDTSDDDSGMEEQDKKRRKVAPSGQ